MFAITITFHLELLKLNNFCLLLHFFYLAEKHYESCEVFAEGKHVCGGFPQENELRIVYFVALGITKWKSNLKTNHEKRDFSYFNYCYPRCHQTAP